jgi:hypothetical protein
MRIVKGHEILKREDCSKLGHMAEGMKCAIEDLGNPDEVGILFYEDSDTFERSLLLADAGYVRAVVDALRVGNEDSVPPEPDETMIGFGWPPGWEPGMSLVEVHYDLALLGELKGYDIFKREALSELGYLDVYLDDAVKNLGNPDEVGILYYEYSDSGARQSVLTDAGFVRSWADAVATNEKEGLDQEPDEYEVLAGWGDWEPGSAK